MYPNLYYYNTFAIIHARATRRRTRGDGGGGKQRPINFYYTHNRAVCRMLRRRLRDLLFTYRHRDTAAKGHLYYAIKRLDIIIIVPYDTRAIVGEFTHAETQESSRRSGGAAKRTHEIRFISFRYRVTG